MVAATAFNADMNNRQIGQEERRLAQSLASKAKVSGLTKPDGSAYAQAEIENAITDKGAVWTSNDGKTLVQVNQDGSNLNPSTIDPTLAAYIVQETGGANTPYKDLYKQVEAAKAGPPTNPNAGLNTIMPAANGAVTAEGAAGLSGVRNPIRDISDIRNDVADGAALVGRGAGIVSNAAVAAEVVPGPHQPAAAGLAATATVIDFTSKVVEQVARPDAGKAVTEVVTTILGDLAAKKAPLAAPISNEIIENIKVTKEIDALQKKVNGVEGKK